MNKIPFFRCDFVYSCGIRLWDAYNDIYWFEDVDIPQDNSVSLTLPCAVGVTNSIQVVYKGNDTIRYGIGKPCSDMKELFLSDKQDEEIVLTILPQIQDRGNAERQMVENDAMICQI